MTTVTTTSAIICYRLNEFTTTPISSTVHYVLALPFTFLSQINFIHDIRKLILKNTGSIYTIDVWLVSNDY